MWRGRRIRAFVPALLSERDLELSPAAAAACGRAQADVEAAAERMTGDHESLGRLLLRAEGLASSFIEGVTAPVLDVVLAEGGAGAAAAGWVAANLAAMSEALGSAHEEPLTVEALCDWHRTLMQGSPTPSRYVGVVRDELGWIGGISPLDAHLVTPPPEHLARLLADLVRYCNDADVDPVAQAAIAHAQFEVIHPFADGNGRVGRILVAWVLARRLALVVPPPVSTRIAADVGGYAAGLTLFRLGQHSEWVQWFAGAVSGGGRAQQELVRAVDALRQRWQSRLASGRGERRRLRKNATAWRVLDLVPRLVVLTAADVADALGVPVKTAHAALQELAIAGVLDEHQAPPVGPGRPRRVYMSTELLGLTGSPPLR